MIYRKGDYNRVVELVSEENINERTDGGLTLLHIVGAYGGKCCVCDQLSPGKLFKLLTTTTHMYMIQ